LTGKRKYAGARYRSFETNVSFSSPLRVIRSLSVDNLTVDSVNDEFRKQIAICQRLEAKFHSYPLCSWCWHLTASKEGIDWKGQAYRSCRKIHASASLGCPLCRSVLENAKPKIVDKRNVYFGYESSKWEPRLKHFRASDREDSNNQASGIRVFIKESTVSPGYEYLPEYFMYVELYKSPGELRWPSVELRSPERRLILLQVTPPARRSPPNLE
jgi:hypothetical protein